MLAGWLAEWGASACGLARLPCQHATAFRLNTLRPCGASSRPTRLVEGLRCRAHLANLLLAEIQGGAHLERRVLEGRGQQGRELRMIRPDRDGRHMLLRPAEVPRANAFPFGAPLAALAGFAVGAAKDAHGCRGGGLAPCEWQSKHRSPGSWRGSQSRCGRGGA